MYSVIIGMSKKRPGGGGVLNAGTGLLTIALCAMLGTGAVLAKGGTAKPPAGGGGGGAAPPGACPVGSPAGSACIIPLTGPVTPNFPAGAGALSGNGSNGFSITGIVQAVTGPGCPATPANRLAAGTVTVNGLTITVPTNTIVQYPANTLTWAESICGTAPIAIDGSGGTGAAIYPGVEIRIDGNITTSGGAAPGPTTAAGIGTGYVAGIIHISQQSVHIGSGYISAINYATGAISVGSTTLIINDPKGRYGRPNASTDARFSVDDANPTIKSGSTGYPMCVPRAVPPAPGGAETDPQCPQKNRPRAACRNFAAAGVTFRVAQDLPTVPLNGFCAGFVMKALAGMPGTAGLAATQLANGNGTVNANFTGDPDPREMAPFEVGDFITWSGTLVHNPGAAVNTDVIWVHTIDANVGIYTQPATLPAYIAVGDNGIGVDPEPKAAAAVVGVEATPRLFLEAVTTDVASVVDIYLDDKGFHAGSAAEIAAAGCTHPCVVPDVAGVAPNEYFRWVTPESMTGTVASQVLELGRGTIIPTAATLEAAAFGGGIYTQFIGPQPGRARIRANAVPAIDATLPCPVAAATVGGTRGCAVTQSPTRYLRVVLRSLCAPANSGTASAVGGFPAVPSNNLAAAPAAANSGAYFDINGNRPNLPGAGTGNYVGVGAGFVGAGDGTCLQSAQYANGLFTGQYFAPVGEYIFPENTLAGFRIVPNNLWHMGFMAFGENNRDANSAGPQVPRPW